MVPQEVFLAHAHGDLPVVERVADVLRRHGVAVWYSERDILGAAQWHDEIGRALARCDWFLVLLSPRSVSSKWVKRELTYALIEDRYDERITPALLRDCDPAALSWTLPGFQMVDLRDDFEEGCRGILRTWGLAHRPI